MSLPKRPSSWAAEKRVRNHSGGWALGGWACLRARRAEGALGGRVAGGCFGVVMYVCIMIYIHTMKDNSQIKKQWLQQIPSLWPALKGSLAKVYKPCIRKNCPACARGDKHPAWLLSLSYQGRRTTMYVPQPMVSTIKKTIQNARNIEQLLYRTGPGLLRNYRKNTQKTHQRHPKP